MTVEPEQNFLPSYLKQPVYTRKYYQLDRQENYEKRYFGEKLSEKILLDKTYQEVVLTKCLPLATLFGGAVLFAARKGHIINGKKNLFELCMYTHNMKNKQLCNQKRI